MKDREFVGRLFDSLGAVNLVGSWLARVGFKPCAPFLVVAPNYESRMQYLDEGDICIWGKKLEVKYRPKITFTSAEDFPFDTIFLGEKYKVDRIFDQVIAYVTVDATKRYVAWVWQNTRPAWKEEDVPIESENRIARSYGCPKDLAQYFWIGYEPEPQYPQCAVSLPAPQGAVSLG